MLMYSPIKSIEEAFQKSSEKFFIEKEVFMNNLK